MRRSALIFLLVVSAAALLSGVYVFLESVESRGPAELLKGEVARSLDDASHSLSEAVAVSEARNAIQSYFPELQDLGVLENLTIEGQKLRKTEFAFSPRSSLSGNAFFVSPSFRGGRGFRVSVKLESGGLVRCTVFILR